MAGAGTEADRGTAMIKLASPGEPPDLDGDVIEKGAFGYPATIILPADDQSHVQLGHAKVNEAGDGVVAGLKFHLDKPAAREWHRSVLFELENGPPTQQWSQGFMAPSSRHGTYDGRAV